MADRLGSRLKLGLLVPAFNVTVQPELDSMRPPGVTNHVSRIEMADAQLLNDDDQASVVAAFGTGLMSALKSVMQAQPGAVIVGISIPVFWRGVAGARALREEIESIAGVRCVLPSDACLAALACYPNVRRIGILTPYQPSADARVRNFFQQADYEVAALHSLKQPSNLGIADADEVVLREGLTAVAAAKPDLILQVGTNLALADLADDFSAVFGVPVIAINAALYWHALRICDIADRRNGFGPRLRDH
ncbi:MAG: maleate isomerase [Rhodospirillaceae bacterium]|nr:maleate isomerase [Rhodospirillaceae bacterium]